MSLLYGQGKAVRGRQSDTASCAEFHNGTTCGVEVRSARTRPSRSSRLGQRRFLTKNPVAAERWVIP